jgi:glycosyltransferase involved in cell wall biosynthesis
MPLVWKKDPTINLHIAGANWQKHKFHNLDQRIMLHGQVSKLDHFLSQIRITVAPLRFGAGVKGKVLESFAAGVPCVMTHIASEGITLRPELDLLVQQDEIGIAAKILEIYSDSALYGKAKKAGLSLISEENTIESIATALRMSLISIESKNPIEHALRNSNIKVAF